MATTMQLSGFIEYRFDKNGNWQKLKLIQPDGYKIDLVTRFQEAKESYPNCQMQVNYWLCEKECTLSEAVGGFLKKLYGVVEAEYERWDYQYSSWTTGTDYDTTLTIGGHDLAKELAEKEGKYLIIELNITPLCPA